MKFVIQYIIVNCSKRSWTMVLVNQFVLLFVCYQHCYWHYWFFCRPTILSFLVLLITIKTGWIHSHLWKELVKSHMS